MIFVLLTNNVYRMVLNLLAAVRENRVTATDVQNQHGVVTVKISVPINASIPNVAG